LNFRTTTTGTGKTVTGTTETTGSTTSNPNIVNGIDRSTLPTYAMSKEGKYYVKDANNNYSEISREAYATGKQAASASIGHATTSSQNPQPDPL